MEFIFPENKKLKFLDVSYEKEGKNTVFTEEPSVKILI